jgi:hypothetical protein
MEKPAVAYLGQRLEALAIIHLTRRKDLVVTKANLAGVNLIVYITSPNEPSRRTFGLMVKGTTEAIADERQATRLMNSMEIEQKGGQLMMPVCVFLFSMRDDQGFFDWQAQPRLEDGKVQLPLKTEFEAKRLDPVALDGLIDEVNRWYDSLYKLPVMGV